MATVAPLAKTKAAPATIPSGGPSAKQRRMFAKTGVAMPDGSYYIRPGHPEDLQNAIDSVGRAAGTDGTSDEQQRNDVRKHIIKRAGVLKMSNKIPTTWNVDGSLKPSVKHDDLVDDFFEHHGIKGMHWGQHKAGSETYSSTRARTQAVHAARVAHVQRMAKIDSHVHGIQEAKTTAEKQKHLDAIHNLAKDPQAKKNVDIAERSTLGEKVISGIAGSLIPIPVAGTAAGVGGQQAYRAYKRETENSKLDAYGSSKLSDYA